MDLDPPPPPPAAATPIWATEGTKMRKGQAKMLAFMHEKQTSKPVEGALGAIINVGMGVGKTFAAIAHVLNHYKPGDAPVLVVTALGIMQEWAQQVDQFVRPEIARKVLFLHSSFKKRMPQPSTHGALAGGSYVMVVTNYDSVAASFNALEEVLTEKWYKTETSATGFGQSKYWITAREPAFAEEQSKRGLFHRMVWAGLFMDESQKANNVSGAAFFKSLMTLCVKGARWALTGTPFRNRSIDYYAQCRLINFTAFPCKKDWCNEQKVRTIFEFDDTEDKIILALSEDEGEERGELTRRTVRVELEAAERAAYDEAEDKLHRLLRENRAGAIGFDNVLTQLGKLRRRTTATILECAEEGRALGERAMGPDGIGSSKLRALVGLVRELAVEGEYTKLIVFSNFQSALVLAEEALRRGLPGAVTLMRIDGSIRPDVRMATKSAFNSFTGGPCVLLLSAGTGTSGLNLQAASGGILIDSGWTAADEEQQVSRFHRPGQSASRVIWCKLEAVDTIDGWVDGVTQRKKAADAVIRGHTRPDQMKTRESLFAHLDARRAAPPPVEEEEEALPDEGAPRAWQEDRDLAELFSVLDDPNGVL